MDILGALVLLLVSAPAFLVVAILVRVTSPGPVFFRQERVGLNGATFSVLKFRSMVADAEARRPEVEWRNITAGPTIKVIGDPRVTRVGRVLRKTSLDELPQIWYVLTGSMSLVGPRPLDAAEVARMAPEVQRDRHRVKPGLTCTWQVSGRSLIPHEEWMRMDVEYAARQSLWLDLTLLARTPLAVLGGRGAV